MTTAFRAVDPGIGDTSKLPVFVINLDRRSDRRKAMFAQLDRLGCDAVRIRATDAHEICDMIPRRRRMTSQQIACRESHHAAIGAFLRTGAPLALILEDDAELSPRVRGLLESADWWPARTNAVRLSSRREDKPLLLGSTIGETPDGRAVRPIAWSCSGAEAYMLNRAGAKIVLDAAPTIAMPMDSALFHKINSPIARLLKSTQVVPGMARHPDDGDSDNSGQNLARATGPGLRASYKAGIALRRLSGRVSRMHCPWQP